MKNQITFRQIAAISAILSAPLAIAAWVLVLIAVDFNPDLAASDLGTVIKLGAPAAIYMKLAYKVADTFGYILLFAPVALYLWLWLKARNPSLVTFSALSGFAYMLTGAITVSALGGLVPPMIHAFAEAPAAEQEGMLTVFQSVFNMLFYGIGPLAWFFGGIWWLGTGAVLRHERRFAGIFTMIMGILSIGVWLEQTFLTREVVGTAFQLLVPVWAIWLGILIWRHTGEDGQMVESGAAA